MNWSNINLENEYEANKNILEPYKFDTLLLEINCNIRLEDINKEEIKKHFEKELNAKIREAREIFKANIDNIVNHAIKEKND
jgi:hypothetical protein